MKFAKYSHSLKFHDIRYIYIYIYIYFFDTGTIDFTRDSLRLELYHFIYILQHVFCAVTYRENAILYNMYIYIVQHVFCVVLYI